MVEFLPFKEKVLVQVQVFSVVEVLSSSSREVREPTAVGGVPTSGDPSSPALVQHRIILR